MNSAVTFLLRASTENQHAPNAMISQRYPNSRNGRLTGEANGALEHPLVCVFTLAKEQSR